MGRFALSWGASYVLVQKPLVIRSCVGMPHQTSLMQVKHCLRRRKEAALLLGY